MRSQAVVLAMFGLFLTSARVPAQTVPIYQVTVVERTVKAVNYQYHTGPTPIDFRGTVLMPAAKGDATVESKAGHTAIDARFDHLDAPTRFGAEYLTYVLWAITPEGHAKNLGEVVANGSDHARLAVTTDLQAFGLLVTAEPYAAVRQPSDVVVVENEIRPDTVGRIEPIQVKAELLPRGQYTYNVPAQGAADSNAPKVSMDRYESILEVYEAQNAIQIARAAGADRYAADTFARAQEMLANAQRYEAQKADRSTVVTEARHAAQTAEDARLIADQKKRDEELAQAHAAVQREQELRRQAELEAQNARAQASADRMQLDQERQSASQTVAPSTGPLEPSPAIPIPQPMTVVEQTPAPAPSAERPDFGDRAKSEMRVRLLGELNAALPSRDTPRGLVITLGDADFRGASLRPELYGSLARVASVIAAQPGLRVVVDGNSDTQRADTEADERMMAVRDALMRSGVPAANLSARNLGDSRPLASNASAAGRLQNRRVEIIISGDPIGAVASWDRPYSLLGH